MTEGFLDPVNDTIRIRYYVRQPSYYQVSVHKAVFGKFLDSEIIRQ
jgi:hypothetical protein